MDALARNKAISILSKIPLFAGLQSQDYQQLLGICKIVHYRTGDIVFRENDPSLAMYVQLSGETALESAENGIVFRMKPGDLFGEIGVISLANRTATATVSDDAMILELDKDKFDFLQGKNPLLLARILRNVAKVLAQRLIHSGSHRYIL
jgi:CRP-like cAMP-binding protein